MQKKEKLSEQLRKYRITSGAISTTDCTREENREFQKLTKNNLSLPEGVYAYQEFDGFYRMDEEPSEKEIRELIEYKKLETLRSIRAWCALIGTIMLLSLLGSLFLLLFAGGIR